MRCFEPDFAEGPFLGRGNFSSSVRVGVASDAARQLGAPPTVALKCCAATNEQHVQALRKEFAVLRTVREAFPTPLRPFDTHGGVISCFDLREGGGELCLVLEHAPGGDLQSYLMQASLSEADMASAARQLLSALAMLHGCGFVHRDVKPHNVLVTGARPMEVKLADFGLIKQVQEGMCRQNSAGDYAFMPPDFRESTEDHMPMMPEEYFKSDTYAVGLTVFYMFAGRAPTQQDLVNLRMPPDYAAQCYPNVTRECLGAVATLLAESSEDRLLAPDALELPWFALLRADSERVLSSDMGEVQYTQEAEVNFVDPAAPPVSPLTQ